MIGFEPPHSFTGRRHEEARKAGRRRSPPHRVPPAGFLSYDDSVRYLIAAVLVALAWILTPIWRR